MTVEHKTPIQLTKIEDEILKRDLITREISRELRILRDSLSLHGLFHDESILHPPKPHHFRLLNITSYFRSSEKDSVVEATESLTVLKEKATDTPLLKYAFNNFILELPFFKNADPKLWCNIQQFLEAYGKLRFGTYAVGKEETSRRERLAKTVESSLVLLFNTGICTVKDNKLENEEPKIPGSAASETEAKLLSMRGQEKSSINVIAVRRVIERCLLREKERPLFIIQSNFGPDQGVTVGRSLSQVHKYIAKIHRWFPTLQFPSPPPKFRNPHEGQLYHEKDRIAFQTHLRDLVANPLVMRSRLTWEFFHDSPIELLPEDMADQQQRGKFSRHRAEEYQKILKVAEDKSIELRESVEQFTKELLEPGGFHRFSQVLHDVSEISLLPDSFQKMIELAKINLAATLYRVFCADENAPINFHQLQQTHGMIPYRTLKGILKISNPTMMMKGILDVFLAQPFGHASIVQRLASANLSESVKLKKQDIEILRAAINNDSLCDKLRNYVHSSEKRPYDDDADSSDLDRLISIITDPSIEPILDHKTIDSLARVKEELAQGLRNTNWSIENLTSAEDFACENSQEAHYSSELQLGRLYRLLILYTQIRNTELTMELVFEGVTGDILKEILTMFYQPLAQVYKDASISDFVMDVSKFVDQLIKVVENSQQQQDESPTETLRQFIELLQAYEGTFYRFVHSLYRQRTDGLFQQLISWFERIFTSLRGGLNSESIDLGELIEESISHQQQDQFKEDLHSLKMYLFECKLRRYRRLHKRMMVNIGADYTGFDQMTSDRLTIPSNLLRKYMKEVGLECLPDALNQKLQVSVCSVPHSIDYSGNASQQFQSILESSGIRLTMEDMLEMNGTESDSDYEEGVTNESGSGSENEDVARGYLNLDKSKQSQDLTEPKIPYPRLALIPNLVGGFVERIIGNLNTLLVQ